MDYIKGLPLAPHRCRSAPHQLPLATAVCILMHRHIPATTLLFPMIILLVAVGDELLPQLLTPFLVDVGASLCEQFQNLRPLV